MAKLAAHGKELARVEIIYDLAGVKRRRQRVLMSDGAVLGQENTVGERRQGDGWYQLFPPLKPKVRANLRTTTPQWVKSYVDAGWREV